MMKGTIPNSTKGGSYNEGWLIGSVRLKRMQKIENGSWTKFLNSSLKSSLTRSWRILLLSSRSDCKSVNSSSSLILSGFPSPRQGRLPPLRRPRKWRGQPSHSMRHHLHHLNEPHLRWKTTTKVETTVQNKRKAHSRIHSQLLLRLRLMRKRRSQQTTNGNTSSL